MRLAHFCAATGLTAALFVACDDERPVGPARLPSGADGGLGGQALDDAGVAGASGAVADSAGGPGGAAGASEIPAADAGASGSGGAEPEALADIHRLPYPPSPYPAENPDSDAKALLGKILFWDEQLGGDNSVACGTCHRPNAGGSDPRSGLAAAAVAGLDRQLGTDDDVHGSLGVVRCNALGEHTGSSVQVTARKAPTYLDAMLQGRLFWDGRAECAKPDCPSFSAFEDPDHPGTFAIKTGGALENQAVGPPLSPVEMACEGASWSAIHLELAGAKPLALAKDVPAALQTFIAEHDSSYPKLFQAAFGKSQSSGPEDEINTRRIAFAIATHERRLRSDRTPWDRWNAGEESALSVPQRRGLELFMRQARCNLCHDPPGFSDADFHFIGFHRPAEDDGRHGVDAQFGVAGALRTPTLRNVGLREKSGLLHNGAGVGSSLERIVELYDQGGLVADPVVTAVPISATMQPLHLSAEQKADLVDFLRHGLDDPRTLAQTGPFERPRLSTE